MIHTRLTALAVAAFLAVPLAAVAQTAPAQTAPAAAASGAPAGAAHRHRRGGRYMRAVRSLDLSADQKSQIATLAKNTRATNRNADPATRKANAQKLRTQIDAVLTPDQRARVQAELAKPASAVPGAGAPAR